MNWWIVCQHVSFQTEAGDLQSDVEKVVIQRWNQTQDILLGCWSNHWATSQEYLT